MRIPDFRDQPAEFDPVSKWALVFLIIIGLLLGARMIIYYAAQHDETKAQLTGNLPANYRETIKAVVASTGHPCREVCALDPVDPVAFAADRGTLKVSCSLGQASEPCAVTRAYTLTVEPTPEPSR